MRFSRLFFTSFALIFVLVSGVHGVESDIGARPTATISLDNETILTGGTAKITGSFTPSNATAYLITATQGMEAKYEVVTSPISKEVSPNALTVYTLFVKKGLKKTYATATLDVTTSDVPDPVKPTDSILSIVAFGDAFQLSDKLSSAARSKDVIGYLKGCSGNWLEVSDATLSEPHNKALDKWQKLFKDSGKTSPCIASYSVTDGKMSAITWNEVNDSTDILALLKSLAPTAENGIIIAGKHHGLGYKKTPPERRGIINGKKALSVKEILTPKTVADIPAGGIDLRHQFTFTLDQNGYGTCVSQAVTGAASVAGYIQFGSKNFIQFSPNELATRIDGWNGAYAEQAIEEAMTNGMVALSYQPNYSNKLPSNWRTKAAKHKVIGVYRSPTENVVGYTIASLLRGYPVIVAIGAGNGFNPDNEGKIGYKQGAANYVNHQVIFCGVRVNAKGQLEWLVKNSWGADWGIFGDGTAWLVDDSGSSSYGWINDVADLDLWVIVRLTAGDDYNFDSPTTNDIEFKDSTTLDITASAIIEKAIQPASTCQCQDGSCQANIASKSSISTKNTCSNGSCGNSKISYRKKIIVRRGR